VSADREGHRSSRRASGNARAVHIRAESLAVTGLLPAAEGLMRFLRLTGGSERAPQRSRRGLVQPGLELLEGGGFFLFPAGTAGEGCFIPHQRRRRIGGQRCIDQRRLGRSRRCRRARALWSGFLRFALGCCGRLLGHERIVIVRGVAGEGTNSACLIRKISLAIAATSAR